jgi:hypothetical protein
MKKIMDLFAAWRKLALFKRIIFSFFCLALLPVIGCSGIKVKDDLSPEMAKGFVKFYRMRSDPGTLCPEIYSVDEKNKKSMLEGEIPWPGIWADRGVLQLARIPGNYTFIVEKGTARQVIHVKIVEGMVTPVSVIISDVKKTSESFGRTTTYTTTFKMGIVVEAPIPLSDDKSQK